MSRSRARQNTTTASLFPFLAVLLSTLGVLVVLLMAMASVQLDEAAQSRKKTNEALPVDLAEQQRLREELQAALNAREKANELRDKVRENLNDAQLRVSAIEENIRRWQDRLDSLRLAINELEELDGQHSDDLQKAEQRLADLRRQIVSAEQQIAELEAELAKRPKIYAILPYDGHNGTKRRPIYIECLRDRVVIQPEGIELYPADFHPQLGAGNPLAAALRAAREHYVGAADEDYEEPYPLIIVRPEGIGSYRTVLSAIDSWESPFGYEMVGEDWKLDFTAANPELALEVATAVDNSRKRQARLAEAAPRAFSGGNLDAFEPKPSLFELIRSGAPLGGGFSAVGGTGLAGSGEGLSPGAGGLSKERIANAMASAEQGSANDRYSSNAAGDSFAVQSQQSFAGGQLGETLGETGNPQQSANSQAGPTAQSGTEGSGSPNQQFAQQQQAEAAAPGSPTASGSQASSSQASAQQASTAAGSAGSSPAINMSSTPGGDVVASGANRNQQQAGSLGVQRPIQVVVRADRLIVVADGERPQVGIGKANRGQTVLLEGSKRDASHRFSTAIKQHIDEWGIAGDGSHWKPVMILNVAPGGEKLADELTRALKAGGMEVRLPSTARR